MLSFKKLTIAIGDKTLVDGVDMTINSGNIIALIGESGSGKSLTALSVVKLLPPQALITGEICYQNSQNNDVVVLSRLDEKAIQFYRGQHIAFIFQDPNGSFNPVITIAEQIDEVIKKRFNLNRKQREQRLLKLLKQVGLPASMAFCRRYSHQYSGGEKQRLMIAQALANNAKIIIADEATSALDLTTQKQVLDLLLSLKEKEKLTILLITHDLSVVRYVADQVYLMKSGKIIEHGDCQSFFAKPSSADAKRLLMTLESADKQMVNRDKKLLSVESLSVVFGRRHLFDLAIFARRKAQTAVLQAVSFDLYKGEALAIVGESGSGKSTIANVLIKQLKPSQGRVFLANQNQNNIDNKLYAQSVQIIFQHITASFNPRMRVGDSILEGLKALKPERATVANLDALLTSVELTPELASRYPHQLSGGQLQRVAIARALAIEPKVMICDEPTSALDVMTKTQILLLLKRIQEKTGIALLLITHDMAVVRYLAHRVCVLKKGRIVETALVDDLFKTPQHAYTKTLLSAVL